MKVWFGVIGLLVGAAVGLAAGFALQDPADLETPAHEDAAAVPPACLEAISAARDRLLLNPEVTETLRDYRDLGERLADDVSDLRVPNLRETLASLNDLNERSAELVDRSVNARFTAAANECEQIAADRGGPVAPSD